MIILFAEINIALFTLTEFIASLHYDETKISVKNTITNDWDAIIVSSSPKVSQYAKVENGAVTLEGFTDDTTPGGTSKFTVCPVHADGQSFSEDAINGRCY